MLEVHWEFVEGNRELVENSLEVCWEVHREFTDMLSGAHREFAGRMLGVRWEFIEGNQELVGGSPKGCREFAERRSDNEDWSCSSENIISHTKSVRKPTAGRSYIPVFQIQIEKMKEVKRPPL
ncbi:hypothetical protein B296_00058668 [Ensete ventricosum]|uniref:Uncharacterized protein n=1 Tax=Ensete ventricosum TaxID=4639 RepID=A0A426XCF3_ENSVE|nr:hypothetical protein B296_00058668 [Ensete ventricosum]